MPARLLRQEFALDHDDDPELLRGALLAAKATDLSEAHRGGARPSCGYGSDSARRGHERKVSPSFASTDAAPVDAAHLATMRPERIEQPHR